MNVFVSSARKYRPIHFESVVGQNHITKTLEYAIVKNLIPQTLLFCGPRGVGKTTCARIFARKINEVPGCNIDVNLDFNIFELDAASNNSVDDIRNLIDQVRYPPQIGKYKIYIIDEVHMLSNQAFNAFLKTLEEPPNHVIFILATTEKQKIISTILSRCQIFDFKPIDTLDIQHYLEKVAKKEGVFYDNDSLFVIAQKSEGSLRDALFIFDRLVTVTHKNLQFNKVLANLNILDYDIFLEVTDCILKKNIEKVLLFFNDVLKKGFSAQIFISGLTMHFRNLIFSQNFDTMSLLEFGEEIKKKYVNQTKKCDLDFLFSAVKICYNTEINYKMSKNQRLIVEIALIEIIRLQTI